jgi:PRTRC genetic system protein C
MTIEEMKREFVFNGIRLPDPNPKMAVDDVRAIYAIQYPEIATAALTGPEAVAGKMRYTFERAIGSKG